MKHTSSTHASLHTLTALRRPRCRISWGEPGDDAGGWNKAEPLPAIQLWNSCDLVPPPTGVRALAGRRELFVRFDCRVENQAMLRPRQARGAITEHEHVFCDLMPRNDPTDRWRIAGTFAEGAMKISRTRMIPGEASLGGAYDTWQTSAPIGEAGQEIRALFGVEGDGWWMEFIVPWGSLGLSERPATIGFHFGRGAAVCGSDPLVLLSAWPDDARSSNCPRLLEPGEAIIGPDAGTPEGIELEQPRFGTNRGRLIVGRNWPQPPARLRVSVESPESVVRTECEILIPGGSGFVDFQYELHREHSSHLEPFRTSALVFEVLGRNSNQAFYQARLPMDRHLGMCVDEPYGMAAIEDRPGTIRERWLERVVRTLPRLARKTTAQGAPSDFCLVHEDGTLAVNLMDDDPWKALSTIVEQRFDTSEDRLVASMALVGQKSVTNLVLDPMFFNAAGAHTYHSPHHELMGPLSILRYGGGSALCRAAVLAGLLQRVTDRATGRPFVARIVSLTAQGGPRQTTRSYAGCSNLAPFVQEPGRVGTVAVDHAASQTLLDPTALAFFPASEGKLATIEQVLSDEILRKQGADRLAPVYSKIDIEEVRRQPANHLLSKGVFPELCLDEDGSDRPFAPQERQTLRVLQSGKSLDGFHDTNGKPGQRKGSVSVESDEHGLRFTVAINGVDLDRFNHRDREMERVHLLIDTTHAHRSFHHFQATLAGDPKAWREEASGIQTLFKHLSTENHIEICPLPKTGWSVEIELKGNTGYQVQFAISWELLGLGGRTQRPPVIGVNVWVDGRHPGYEQLFLSPPRRRLPADPFSFADFYLTNTLLQITEIDLGVPGWGSNQGKVVIENHGHRDLSMTLHAETHLSMRRCVHQDEPVRVTVPARGSATIDFPFRVDPEEKMTAGQSLKLIAVTDGAEWWRGEWRVTYCGPVSAYQRYGAAVGQRSKPDPGSPGFIQLKIDFICSRIPEFRRLTTRDGVPSDFFLRAVDGSVEFNLMEAGVLDRFAEYTSRLFDNDLDRLLGLFYLNQHPAVARHMSAGHRFMEGADPLSVLRGNFAGGGGNCGFHARSLAGMMAHLRIGGKPLIAHTLGIAGHSISAIGWKGSKVLLDGDVGHLFFKPDGSDLATIEDMRGQAGIRSTAGPGDLARYFTFSDNRVRHMQTAKDGEYPGVFPPGAPKA